MVLVMVVLGLRTTDVQYPVATGLATPLANSCPIAGKFQLFSRGRDRPVFKYSLDDAKHSSIRRNYFTFLFDQIRDSITTICFVSLILVMSFFNPVFVDPDHCALC